MKGNLLFLLISVFLSSARSLFSKKTALKSNGNSNFFFLQTVLFFSATLILFLFNVTALRVVSTLTLLLGIIYGILLILSQWMYTFALKYGNTSVCTVIYSLGFIIPTLFGAIVWSEKFTVLNGIGIAVVVFAIIMTAQKENAQNSCKNFIPFAVLAMLFSGGLGVMQKIEQKSSVYEEKAAFLIIAFLVAFIISFCTMIKEKEKPCFSYILYPSLTGVCFGGANFFNTALAGRMNSAVFFPLQNISTILLSTLFSVFLFKEKLTERNIFVIILGITAVIIFSI